MRIRAFHLDAFGPLRDLVLEGLPAGFAIFLGRNEAGKTTLLDFFRSTLTGYPLKPRDPRERAYASTGQTGGGSLLLESDLGFLRLTRRPGPGGGSLALADVAGKTLDTALWERLLGGVTREVYASVYGFSLSELQVFDSLDSEGVRHALYGASFGQGLRSPGAALKRLDATLNALFRERGSQQKMPLLARSWEETRKAIRALEEEAAQYDGLAGDVAMQRTSLAELARERAGLEKERRALERRLGVWRQWEDWRLAGARLERLEAVPASFPEDGPARLERALERRESAVREAALARERVAKTLEECAACTVDEVLLASGETLRELAGRKASSRNALIAIPGLRAALARTGADLERELGTLGPAWTCERVEGLERSLAQREAVESEAEALRNTALNRDAARANLEQLRVEEADARGELAAAQARHEALPAPVVDLADAEREALRRSLEHTEEALRRLPERERDAEAARQHFNRALNLLHLRPRQNSAQALEDLSAAQEEALGLSSAVVANLVALQEAKRQAEQARDEEIRFRARYERLQNEREGLGESDREDLDTRRRMLRALRSTLARQQMEENRLLEAEERFSTHMAESPQVERSTLAVAFGLILALTGGAALIARYLFGITSLPLRPDFALPLEVWLGYLVFLAGVAFIGAGLPRRRPEAARHAAMTEQVRARRDSAASKLQELQDEVGRLCAALRINVAAGAPDAHFVDSLEADLDQEREQCAAGERLEQVMADQGDDLRAMQRRAQTLAAEHEEKSAAMQNHRRRWHEFLMERGVQSVPLPEDATAFFARVDSARMLWSGVTALEKELAEMEGRGAELIALAQDLLPESERSKASLARVMEAVRQALESCRLADLAAAERAGAAEAVRQSEARVTRCVHAEMAASATLAAAETALVEARRAWEESLRGLGLDEHFSPATAREALDCMDRVLALAAERRRYAEDLARQERERDALLRPLQSLLEALGRAPCARASAQGNALKGFGNAAEDDPDWLALLDQTQRAYEADRRRFEAKTALEARKAEQESELSQAEALLADAVRAVDWLLRMAEASDVESFLRKNAVRVERESLRRRREDLEDALRLAAADTARLAKGEEKVGRPVLVDIPADAPAYARADVRGADAGAGIGSEAGGGDVFQAFLQGFATTEEDEHAGRLKTVSDRLAVIVEEEARLAEVRAAAEFRLQSLASSERLASLRLEEAAATHAIRELAQDWSRAALAKHLLLEAKARFEQERQPEVIRTASALFAAITDNKWQAVNASLEDSSLSVLPAHGPAISPELLSRGTREQLYLALRLAHIRNHAAQATPLPVIMDDVLVNFDPERAERTAAALGTLCEAENGAPAHQVLFFTCHPHIAHKLREIVPGSVLYGMENGAIREL